MQSPSHARSEPRAAPKGREQAAGPPALRGVGWRAQGRRGCPRSYPLTPPVPAGARFKFKLPMATQKPVSARKARVPGQEPRAWTRSARSRIIWVWWRCVWQSSPPPRALGWLTAAVPCLGPACCPLGRSCKHPGGQGPGSESGRDGLASEFAHTLLVLPGRSTDAHQW